MSSTAGAERFRAPITLALDPRWWSPRAGHERSDSDLFLRDFTQGIAFRLIQRCVASRCRPTLHQRSDLFTNTALMRSCLHPRSSIALLRSPFQTISRFRARSAVMAVGYGMDCMSVA